MTQYISGSEGCFLSEKQCEQMISRNNRKIVDVKVFGEFVEIPAEFVVMFEFIHVGKYIYILYTYTYAS